MEKIKSILGVFVLTMIITLCLPKSVLASDYSENFKRLSENGEILVKSLAMMMKYII